MAANSFIVHEYIREFNKIVKNINFLSSSYDVTLKNKLLLIQKDITNISKSAKDYNSFELFSFFTNIYNILNQSSDPTSALITGCLGVLTEASTSRNNDIKNMIQDLNFLPCIMKLLVFMHDENEERLSKLLILLKDLLGINNELDEHNMKCLISSLCDHIVNSPNEKIIKLSLHILSNLAMSHQHAKYLISRSIKASEIQEKIGRTDNLIEMKFFALIINEFLPKDFPHLIILSLTNISSGVYLRDVEPILHSLDLLRYARELSINEQCHISENHEIENLFEGLNELLMEQCEKDEHDIARREYFERLLEYYTQLLEFDDKLVSVFKKFTQRIISTAIHSKSAQALSFFSGYISFNGKLSNIEHSIESIIEYFNDETNEAAIYSNHKYEFLKFLKILYINESLDNTHFKSVLEYVEKIIKRLQELKADSIDEETIFLTIYFLDVLYAFCRDAAIFRDSLDKILNLEILPCIVTKAFALKSEDIFTVLFQLMTMERFPNVKVAQLLSKSHHWNRRTFTQKEYKQKLEPSTSIAKYMNGQLYNELSTLIEKVNRKIDGNEIEGLKTSDVISLYRQKNNYLQVHLNSANTSLEKFADLCNEVQQQNCVLTKLGEKFELSNWCLQLDKEKVLKENHKLENANHHFIASLTTFRAKIDKEIAQNVKIQKTITIKDMEIESNFNLKFISVIKLNFISFHYSGLQNEKSSMEAERLKFKFVQKENVRF